MQYKKLVVVILPSTAFYPWRLFCCNDSRVVILPYLLHFSQWHCGIVVSALVLRYQGCGFKSQLAEH